ncbi:MAG: DUF4097 family beta strand repeat-containing protein [Ruminococcus sp.]|jgi:hypothetical protein|nr:DUF4097 family beta strand repeat-containing protein [Ruminococcus sp.]
MTADEYLSELRSYLDVLPNIEADAATAFYQKDFERTDSDTSVMLRLGNPYALAKKIISEQSDFNKSEQYKNLKKDGMTNAVSLENIDTDYLPRRENVNQNLSSDYTADYRPDFQNDYKSNVQTAFSPSDQTPDTVPKIKTAYDSKVPRYSPPPKINKNRPPKAKSSRKKFILGCIAGLFILGFAFTAIVYIDAVWDYPGEHGPVQVYDTYAYPVDPPEEYTVYNANGVSEDGSSYQGLPLTTSEIEGTVDSININLNNTDVEIVYGDTLRITHTDSVVAGYSSGYLTLTNDQFDSGYVKIEIPETDERSSLTLSIASGNITVEGLRLNRLSLDTSSEAVIDFININVADRTDISDNGSSTISFINSFLNDTTVNCWETDLSFVNTTFSESLSITSTSYMTKLSNCKFTEGTLFDFTNN